MRLRRRQHSYKLPPVESILFVTINDIMLVPLSYGEFIRKDKTIIGIPTAFTIDQDANKITFWPAPARAMRAIIRYFPALKEI